MLHNYEIPVFDISLADLETEIALIAAKFHFLTPCFSSVELPYVSLAFCLSPMLAEKFNFLDHHQPSCVSDESYELHDILHHCTAVNGLTDLTIG